MNLRINGTSIANYVKAGGVKWQRNDVDGPNAGRLLDATMERDRVAIKITLEITCRPLRKAEALNLLGLISPEFVTVSYDDPMTGARNVQMYSNNVPATYIWQDAAGVEWWDGIAFPLVEK